jgi:hypothetical protein
MLSFGCFKDKKKMYDNPEQRKHVLFEKGCEKLPKDLDAITLINSIKTLKMLSRIVLNRA